MKKRIISMLMVVMMILSLTACGKKGGNDAATAKDVLTKIAEYEGKQMDMTFDIEVEGEKMSFRIAASQLSDTEVGLDMYMTYGTSGEVKLTTMYGSNTEIYVNLQEILDALVVIEPSFAAYTAYYQLPSDWVLVTLEDLKMLYAMMGVDTTAFDLAMAAEEDQKASEEFETKTIEAFGNFLDEYANAAGNEVLAVENGTVTFKLNNENVAAAMKALASIDVEKYINDYVAAVESIEGTEETVEQLKEMSVGLNDAIKDLEAEAANVSDDDKVNLTCSFGTDAKGANVTFAMTEESDYQNMTMSFVMNMTEKATGSYSAPAEYTTLTELLAALGMY